GGGGGGREPPPPPPSEPPYRTRCNRSLLPLLDHELIATVLGPARFGVLGAHGPLFTVRDDRHPVGADALRDTIVHRGLGPAIAERQVVLVGAALVTMAFDQQELVGVLLQPGGAGVQGLGVARTNHG